MLPEIMIKKLTRHFHFQDFNKDGLVEKADWEQCAQNLASIRRWGPASAEYKSILDRHLNIWTKNWLPADLDGDGKIALEEYLDLTDRLRREKKLSMDMLLDLFGAIFDILDQDGDRKINIDDFITYFKAWGVDEALAQGAFDSIDLNRDGILSRQIFVQFGANFFISDDPNDYGNFIFGALE